MKFLFALIAALCALISVTQAEVPLPRPRPAELAAAPALPAPKVEIDPVFAGEPREASACQARLVADRLAAIEVLPSIKGPGDCGAIDLVRLKEIVLPDRSRVTVTPAPTLRCEMAEAVTHWVREDVVTELSKIGGVLRALDNFDSYECRGRNRVAGAKTSEHGRGNALDVRGMALTSGKFVDLTDRNVERDFREAIRRSVCTRFATVLGPRSDGYHENHIHLDLAERRGGYKLCQWAVLDSAPDIPLPRPRPAELPSAEEGRIEE